MVLAFAGVGAPSCVALPEGGNVADQKPDIARWVEEEAKAVGLPIAPEYRANVILNLERSLVIAQPLLAVELEDELTPLPVYRP